MADDDPDDERKPVPAEQVTPVDDYSWLTALFDPDDDSNPNDDAPSPAPAEQLTPESIYDVRLLRTPDAAEKLEWLKEEYSNDPDFDIAWRAIDLACQCGRIKPDWLRSYLGQAANVIVANFREARRSGRPPKGEGQRILRALGYNKGRGRRGASTTLLIRDRDRNVFEAVHEAVFPFGSEFSRAIGAPVKLDNAYDLVAADFGVSRETVIDGVKRHLRRLKYWDDWDERPSTMEQYVELLDARRKRREGTK